MTKYFFIALLLSLNSASYSAKPICIKSFLVEDSFSSSREAKFLNKFEIIRIGIMDAPGMGHQMSSYQIGLRLRDIGYEGEIQFVFEPGSSTKIEIFFPKSREKLDQPVYFVDENFRFVPIEAFKNNPNQYGEVGLSFIGGEDDMNKVLHPNRPSTASMFRSQMLIRLQPKNWLLGKHDISLKNGDKFELDSIAHLAVRMGDTQLDFDNSLESIANELGLSSSSKKALLITKLLSRDSQFEIAPFYDAQISRVHSLRRYVEGIKLAQDKNSELFSGTPIVLAMSEFSDFNIVNIKTSFDKLPHLKGRVSFSEVEDLEMSQLGEANTLNVIHLNKLPPRVFWQIFKRGTIPSALSGKFSRQLGLTLGRPFMETHFNHLNTEIELSNQDTTLLSMTWYDFQPDRDNPSNPQETLPYGIVEFIGKGVSQEDNSLRSSFRLKSELISNEPDKVVEALIIAERIYEKEISNTTRNELR